MLSSRFPSSLPPRSDSPDWEVLPSSASKIPIVSSCSALLSTGLRAISSETAGERRVEVELEEGEGEGGGVEERESLAVDEVEGREIEDERFRYMG